MKRSSAAALAALALGAFSGSLYFASPAIAEDATPTPAAQSPVAKLPETVVTADRIEVPREDVGRAIDARNAQDFKEQETSSINDSLQTMPGVRSENLGGPGSPGTTPIEIRGFRESGTQLLLNGLRLNDPSSISGIADSFFAFLTSTDLRGIELLKGSNGTLYGSDGQAGSLNLLSEMPGDGVHSELSFRGGTFSTFEESAKLNAGDERGGLVTTVTQINSKGIDSDRRYDNTTVTAVGKYNLNEELSVIPIFRLVEARNSLDTSPTVDSSGDLVPNMPSENNHSSVEGFFYGLTTDYKPDDTFDSKLSIYANNVDRNFFFDFGDGSGGANSEFKGESFNVDWQNSLPIPSILSVFVGGLEYEHQDYKTITGAPDDDSAGQDRYAAFLKDRLSLLDDNLNITGGMRLTQISAIHRTLPIFEASGVLKCPVVATRLHSSVSQGFRAPSLYETHGKLVNETTGVVDTVGNRSLDPEETLSFDVGVTQPLFDKALEADVTFFNLSSDNTVVFDFSKPAYLNGGGGETQGFEYALTSTPLNWLKLRGAYTYLGEANVGGERLQRRPRNVFAIASSADFGLVNWYTELRYRDHEKVDFFGVTDSFNEDAYAVLDTALTVPVDKYLELFVRADNLFDAHYTEAGYRTPGISFFGGLRVKLGS